MLGFRLQECARERCWHSHNPLPSSQTDTSPPLSGYTLRFKNSCESLQLVDGAKEMGERPRDPLEGYAL